jgi:hypothetical protein
MKIRVGKAHLANTNVYVWVVLKVTERNRVFSKIYVNYFITGFIIEQQESDVLL